MSVELDADLEGKGTKFRLFPQPGFLEPFQEPETVWVSPRAGSIGPGPADDRMYVVDTINKEQPYQFPYLPPYDGPVRPLPNLPLALRKPEWTSGPSSSPLYRLLHFL